MSRYAPPSVEPLSEHVSDGTLGYRVANALSYVINPLVLPPIGFGLIAAHFGAPGREVFLLVTIAVVCFGVLPLAYIAWMVLSGQAGSLEIRQRGQRTKPLLFGIASYFLGVVLVGTLGQTQTPLLVALALTLPLNTLLTLVITLRWKISIHVIGLAGFVAGLFFVAVAEWLVPTRPVLTPRLVLPVMALLPLLMWARVRAHAHSPAQVTAGAVFGFVATYLELALFAHFWGLVA